MMQLNLPLDRDLQPPAPEPSRAPLPQLLIGSWCGGERFVARRDETELVPAHVWFHFFNDDSASVTIRYREEHQPLVASGRWELDGELLILRLGHSEVRGRPELRQGLLHWAGEVLIRVPEGLAPYPAMQMRS